MNDGVYILQTHDGYRVKYLRDVKRVYFDPELHAESMDSNIWIANARKMWKKGKHYDTAYEALHYALELSRKLPETENGIAFVEIPKHFT